jgi:hypothetical protein
MAEADICLRDSLGSILILWLPYSDPISVIFRDGGKGQMIRISSTKSMFPEMIIGIVMCNRRERCIVEIYSFRENQDRFDALDMERSNASGNLCHGISNLTKSPYATPRVYNPQTPGTIPHDSAVWTAYVPRTIPSLHPIAENHHASLNAGPIDQCPRNPQSLSMLDLASYQYSSPPWRWPGMRTRRLGRGRPWSNWWPGMRTRRLGRGRPWWVGVRAFIRLRKRRLFPQRDQ